MGSQELIDFIKQHKKQGANEGQVRKSLIISGHRKEDIDAALAAWLSPKKTRSSLLSTISVTGLLVIIVSGLILIINNLI